MRTPLAVACLVLLSACSARDDAPTDGTAEDEIIGGETTADYPDVAHITSGCTATLIHPRAMLTAAHCCQRATSCKAVSIAGRRIRTEPVNHPDFQVAPDGGISPNFDVSILVLNEAVTDVRPRKLARSAPYVGLPIRFIGFGCSAFAARAPA